MNKTVNKDPWGGVKGVTQVHPLSSPHHKSVGFVERKLVAVNGIGGVSRNDTTIDHQTASMPWQPVHMYQPGPPTERLYLEREPQLFGRVQTPTTWTAATLAPDHSRYAIVNQGAIGHMFQQFYDVKSNQ